MKALKKDASENEIEAWLDLYEDEVWSVKSGLFSRMRYPLYRLHEKALEQAGKVLSLQGKIDIVLNVCSHIHDRGVMSSCGFPVEKIYEVLSDGLAKLARSVAGRKKAEVENETKWVEDRLDYLDSYKYVTSGEFCGEDEAAAKIDPDLLLREWKAHHGKKKDAEQAEDEEPEEAMALVLRLVLVQCFFKKAGFPLFSAVLPLRSRS
ncbi:unnamed protein product [Amoebophrya sp. A120]|nr:unnamed protein product [Amoebophrya sp. A120]|eukprot:GSA120T00001693001.1